MRKNRLEIRTPGKVLAQRTARELTQEQLAARVGLSLAIVRWAEKGIASDRTLEKLSKALACSPDDLR
jgi:transcriptional regulator with XRE-family HTH domain